MKRNITAKLIAWKQQKNRKPLIVRGARQVGKSYSIVDFGKNHFDGKTHVVNLEKQLNWHKVFEQDLDAARIVMELEVLLNERIETGKSLLFFDEIQACPRAISALRYFYEQLPDLHVIAAGSLLEFALQDISFPVGRVQLMNIHPMSFSEFLEAVGKPLLVEIIAAPPARLSDAIHELLQAELRRYFFIGGMPECVRTFVETSSIKDVYEVQSDLINTFRQDFSKYAPYADKRCLNDVLYSIAQKTGQQVKYLTLSDGFSNPTIKKAFELLCTARLIHKVRASSPAGLPLRASASDKKFKAILLDIGLLVHLSGLPIQAEYTKGQLLAIFKGALAEQFVGQEFLASGQEELFYWSRAAKSSTAEVDYLIVRNSEIIPVEVKGSSSGRLKSLHLLLNACPDIPEAYVFSDANYGQIPEQKLRFLPLYFASCLG